MTQGRLRHGVAGAMLAVVAIVSAACSTSSADAALRAEMQEAGLSDTSIDCLTSALDVTSMAELNELDPADAEAVECFGQIFEELLTNAFAEAFDDLSIEEWEPIEGTTGDVPDRTDMDQLAEDCRNGDNAACDDLWLVSPIDSDEEALAEACGGRSTEPRMGSCEFWLDE